MASSLPYRTFQPKHPDYCADYWRKCKALYAGGRKLLEDGVMRDVFPRHLAEASEVYAERCARAYYLNYPASIIDMIVAGLFKEAPAFEAEPKPDAWYEDWLTDVSRPGGRVVSFVDLLKAQIRSALVCQRAWTLVEMPEAGDVTPANALEEESSGALDCYAYAVEPECVRDWEMDEDGKLAWALLAFQRSKRAGLESSRDDVEEEFVYYTPTEFRRYLITYPKDKPPKAEAEVACVAEGAHSFGRVPLIDLTLPDGLHAMGKLESIAVAHLNTRNALSWALFKSLFPTPTVYEAPADMANPITEDQGRAVNQPRSPAHIVRLGEKDRFEYVGPDPAPFQYAASDCNVLRDEMYRVTTQMAQSIDNTGAALQRSGASKSLDNASAAVVLKFLGQEVAKHAIEVLHAVGCGRKDPEVEWSVLGMEEFDLVDMDAVLKEATAVTTIDVPSPTFQRCYKEKFAKEVLGDSADAETLHAIHEELEANIPDEEFAPKDEPEMPDEMVMGAEGMPDDMAEPDGNAKPTGKAPVPVINHVRGKPGAKR